MIERDKDSQIGKEGERWGREREREREKKKRERREREKREKERKREKEKERDRQSDRQREREGERGGERERETETFVCFVDVLRFIVFSKQAHKTWGYKKDQLSITHNDMYKSCSYHRVT